MKKRMPGFTLLELMVVLVIVGLLLGLGVPAMGNFISSSRMTSAANDVVGALHLARSEAMKRRVPVSFCTSADALVADPACADSELLQGWIVFVDTDGDGTRDAGEEVLKQGPAPAGDIVGTASLDPLALTWVETGFTAGAATLTLTLCDARGNVASGGELSAARAVTVSAVGRPAVTRDPADITTLGGCP